MRGLKRARGARPTTGRRGFDSRGAVGRSRRRRRGCGQVGNRRHFGGYPLVHSPRGVLSAFVALHALAEAVRLPDQFQDVSLLRQPVK